MLLSGLPVSLQIAVLSYLVTHEVAAVTAATTEAAEATEATEATEAAATRGGARERAVSRGRVF